MPGKPRTMIDATITLNTSPLDTVFGNYTPILSLQVAGETMEQIEKEYLMMIKNAMEITVTKTWENGAVTFDIVKQRKESHMKSSSSILPNPRDAEGTVVFRRPK